MNPSSSPLPATAPAYASEPLRRGWLVALLVFGVLGAALGAWLFGAIGPAWLSPDPGPGPRSSAPDARAVEAARAAIDRPLVEPVKPVVPAPESESANAPAEGKGTDRVPPAAPASTPSAMTGSPPAAAAPAAPVPVSEGPSRGPSSAPAPRAEPPKNVPRAAPAPGVSPASRDRAMVATPPSAGTAPPQAVSDRWDELHQELARCTRDSLIPRIACEQRLRARYCDGYWGSVPDCPSGRQDHGN